MGILSKLKQRKLHRDESVETKKEIVEEEKQEVVDNVQIKELSKRKKKKRSVSKDDVDIAKSLATYIVAFEVLTAMYFDEDDDFVKVYDKFRKDWKIEDLINKVMKYDSLFRMVYKEVDKWLNQ